MIKDLLEHAIFITDGATLCETMHARGINIRYLGYFLEKIAPLESLSYIYVSFRIFIKELTLSDHFYIWKYNWKFKTIGINELVSRCVKRSFRQYVQSVSSTNLSTSVAHYLNCYLSNSAKLQSNTSLNNNNSNNVVQSDNNNNNTEQIANKTSNKKRKKNQRKNNKFGKFSFN